MGILDITNRTENWKTASSFAPFFENPVSCQNLARKLLEPLGGTVGTPAEEIKIELFWKGVRDQMHQDSWGKKSHGEKAGLKKEFADRYNRRFSELRQKVEAFPDLTTPQEWNYRPVVADKHDKFFNNLWHTEIDVVLESPEHLFIGEAKHESDFGNDGKHVLVHQLIRQYVTAKLLVEHLGQAKQVIPFIVADRGKLASVNNTAQVKFMLEQGWLNEANILSWDDITALKGRSA